MWLCRLRRSARCSRPACASWRRGNVWRPWRGCRHYGRTQRKLCRYAAGEKCHISAKCLGPKTGNVSWHTSCAHLCEPELLLHLLQALPFMAETVSQRRHQEQLEAQLAEVEEAIRTFSRSKVLVEA